MAKAKKKMKTAALKAAKKTAAPKAGKKTAKKIAALKAGKKAATSKSAKKAAASKAGTKVTSFKPVKKSTASKVAKKAAAPKAATPKTTSAPKAAAKGAQPVPAKAAGPAGRRLSSALLTPLDDRVLVRVEDGERVTAGGLIIPDTASVEGNHRGVVVSVGAGHRDKKGRLRPLELRVGDQVLFSEYAGSEVRLENQNFKILRETDILGLVTK